MSTARHPLWTRGSSRSTPVRLPADDHAAEIVVHRPAQTGTGRPETAPGAGLVHRVGTDRVGLTGRPGRWEAATTRLPSRGDPRARPPDFPTTCARRFQRTVARDPDAVALRTPGDAVSLTWREYGERVRRIAAGLHALGVRRGRHRRPDADQPPRVRAGRRGRDAPRRGAVLGLQHLLARAGRLPVRQRRQPGGGLRGRDLRRGRRRRRRPRPRRLRRRRPARHHDAGRARGGRPRTASTSRRPGGPSSPTTW